MNENTNIDTICDLCISKGLPLQVGTNKISYCIIEEPLKTLEGKYRSKAYSRDENDTQIVYHCTFEVKKK